MDPPGIPPKSATETSYDKMMPRFSMFPTCRFRYKAFNQEILFHAHSVCVNLITDATLQLPHVQNFSQTNIS